MADLQPSLITYDEPTPELLRGPGHRTELGGARVEYLSFAGPNGTDAEPVVLFGGAFQTYWSFRHDVARLRRRWPVILLNLPGQGTNFQPSEGMDFTALAELARRFFDHHDIDRIVPVGLSYGSGLVHRFATLFPERTRGLILGGTAPRLQPSLWAILEAARYLDQQGECEAWAWSCVFHLINWEAREETGLEDDLPDRFYRSLMRIPPEDHERWWTNSVRLFTEELSGTVECRALVFAGAHDHFMPPFQAAQVARGCRDASFGVMDGVDHLAPVERPDRVLDLYEAFLTEAPLGDLPWLHHDEAGFAACEDRRVCARARVEDVVLSVEDAEGQRSRVVLKDLGYHGAGFRWDGPAEPPSGPAPFRIRLEDGVGTLAVLCPDSPDATRMRFLFTDPVERARWIEAVGRELG